MTKSPENEHLPKHVAIIMDGNGRWAKQRGLPRGEGHKRIRDFVKNGGSYLGICACTQWIIGTYALKKLRL